MKYEIRKLAFIKTWEEALNLYLANFIPLVVIALFSAFPLLLISPLPQAEGTDITIESPVLAQLIRYFFVMAWSTLAGALLIEFISKKLLGKQQQVSQYIQNIFNRIGPIIGLAIVNAVLVGLGLMAFIIPGVYLALTLSLAVEVLIIEGKGITDSIKRSFFLTQGKKMEIFLFTLILILTSFSLQILLNFIFSIVGQSQKAIDVDAIILLVSQALLAPMSACIFILIYFSSRIEKEGFDLEFNIKQSSPDNWQDNDPFNQDKEEDN
jgi:hypothetical protein